MGGGGKTGTTVIARLDRATQYSRGLAACSVRTTGALEYWVPEFTNEVQHFRLEVLPWGGVTDSFLSTIDARLPDLRRGRRLRLPGKQLT